VPLRAVPDTALLALYASIAHEPLRISERISERVQPPISVQEDGAQDGANYSVYSSVRPQGASLGATSIGADHGGAAAAAAGAAALAAVPAASAEAVAIEALALLMAATQTGSGASSGDVGILSDGSPPGAGLTRAHVVNPQRRLVDRTIDWQVAYYNLLDGARHLRHAVARALVPSRLARHAPATAL
jgi:hypothetical protein